MPITSSRLHIRPVTVADAALLLALLNDPDFLRFVGDRGVRDLPAAEAYIARILQEQAGTPWRLLVVSLTNTADSIGVCSFLKREALEYPDLGFAFLPAYRGQGYAFEATQATLQHLRRSMDLPRLLAIVSADNQRSISLLEKLGFRLQGDFKPGSPNSGRTLLYQLTTSGRPSNTN